MALELVIGHTQASSQAASLPWRSRSSRTGPGRISKANAGLRARSATRRSFGKGGSAREKQPDRARAADTHASQRDLPQSQKVTVPSMPMYAFECRKCGSTFDELVFNDERISCPKCESRNLKRLLSVPARPQSNSAELPTTCRSDGPPCGTHCSRWGR